jgi:putative sterol carrier protein
MVVTKEEIIAELNKFRLKFSEEKTADEFKNWNKIMLYHLTDIDDYYYIKLINGKPEEPRNEKIDNPEITYQMTAGTFMDLMHGKTTGMKAYITGKVKVKASVPDLMKLQKLQ